MACDAGTVLNSASIDSYSDDVWGEEVSIGGSGGRVGGMLLSMGMGLPFRRGGGGSGGDSFFLPTGYAVVVQDGVTVTQDGKVVIQPI